MCNAVRIYGTRCCSFFGYLCLGQWCAASCPLQAAQAQSFPAAPNPKISLPAMPNCRIFLQCPTSECPAVPNPKTPKVGQRFPAAFPAVTNLGYSRSAQHQCATMKSPSPRMPPTNPALVLGIYQLLCRQAGAALQNDVADTCPIWLMELDPTPQRQKRKGGDVRFFVP